NRATPRLHRRLARVTLERMTRCASIIRLLCSTPQTSRPRAASGPGVLDGTVDTEDDWHMVIVEGAPRVGVQLAPNHVPPDWPDGTPPTDPPRPVGRGLPGRP